MDKDENREPASTELFQIVRSFGLSLSLSVPVSHASMVKHGGID